MKKIILAASLVVASTFSINAQTTDELAQIDLACNGSLAGTQCSEALDAIISVLSLDATAEQVFILIERATKSLEKNASIDGVNATLILKKIVNVVEKKISVSSNVAPIAARISSLVLVTAAKKQADIQSISVAVVMLANKTSPDAGNAIELAVNKLVTGGETGQVGFVDLVSLLDSASPS